MNTEETTVQKPPLGVYPRWRWDELRASELRDAIARYESAGFAPPAAWVSELQGLGIIAGNLGEIEADSPADRQPHENESITPEALEKEGWKKNRWGDFIKGRIYAAFEKGLLDRVEVMAGSYAGHCEGVKSMPDLRTLVRLVNGE